MLAFARLDSSIIQYAPRPDRYDTLALRADRIDELVDWSTPLRVDHHAGSYDVVVRVFDRTVSTTDALGGRTAVRPIVEVRARLEVLPAGGGVDAR